MESHLPPEPLASPIMQLEKELSVMKVRDSVSEEKVAEKQRALGPCCRYETSR